MSPPPTEQLLHRNTPQFCRPVSTKSHSAHRLLLYQKPSSTTPCTQGESEKAANASPNPEDTDRQERCIRYAGQCNSFPHRKIHARPRCFTLARPLQGPPSAGRLCASQGLAGSACLGPGAQRRWLHSPREHKTLMNPRAHPAGGCKDLGAGPRSLSLDETGRTGKVGPSGRCGTFLGLSLIPASRNSFTPSDSHTSPSGTRSTRTLSRETPQLVPLREVTYFYSS